MRRSRQPPRLEQPPFIEEHKRFVKVDQRGPNQIFILDEHLFRLREELDPLKRLPGATGGDGSEGKRFRGLIAETQFQKAFICRVSQLPGFRAEVQLKIDFGQVEVTKGELIGIILFAGAGRSVAQHLNRAPILASQEVEIGDVVVGIGNQDRHAPLFTLLPGNVVKLQRFRKIIRG